jgi:hypothetical protein
MEYNSSPLPELNVSVVSSKDEYSALHGLVSVPAGKISFVYSKLTIIDDATLSDRKRLKEQYGIKTIMDLRTV